MKQIWQNKMKDDYNVANYEIKNIYISFVYTTTQLAVFICEIDAVKHIIIT